VSHNTLLFLIADLNERVELYIYCTSLHIRYSTKTITGLKHVTIIPIQAASPKKKKKL